MTVSRLEIALDEGLMTLPAGKIVVFGADGPGDVAALPKEQVCIVQRQKPSYDDLERLGYDMCLDPPVSAAGAIVFLPRSKAEARATIEAARALSDGPVIVDGQKTDGIESIYRDLRKRAEVTPALSKAHGKLFAFTAEAPFDGWADPGDLHPAPGFVTRVGIFSVDAVDRGSAVLADALPPRLPKRIADLGAGWGYLSLAALDREGVDVIDLIEADHRALECAKRNITDPRASFHWADATAFKPAHDYDAILMNPPFHTGSATTPALGTAFIEAAAAMLRPSGQLWLVANRHLPYERTLAHLFAEVREIGNDPSFKLYHASRPRRQRR